MKINFKAMGLNGKEKIILQMTYVPAQEQIYVPFILEVKNQSSIRQFHNWTLG